MNYLYNIYYCMDHNIYAENVDQIQLLRPLHII